MHIHEALVCVWICCCGGKIFFFLISCKHTKMEKHGHHLPADLFLLTVSSIPCFSWVGMQTSSLLRTEEVNLHLMRVNACPSVSLFAVWSLIKCIMHFWASFRFSFLFLVFWLMFVLSVYDYGLSYGNDACLCVDPTPQIPMMFGCALIIWMCPHWVYALVPFPSIMHITANV